MRAIDNRYLGNCDKWETIRFDKRPSIWCYCNRDWRSVLFRLPFCTAAESAWHHYFGHGLTTIGNLQIFLMLPRWTISWIAWREKDGGAYSMASRFLRISIVKVSRWCRRRQMLSLNSFLLFSRWCHLFSCCVLHSIAVALYIGRPEEVNQHIESLILVQTICQFASFSCLYKSMAWPKRI